MEKKNNEKKEFMYEIVDLMLRALGYLVCAKASMVRWADMWWALVLLLI